MKVKTLYTLISVKGFKVKSGESKTVPKELEDYFRKWSKSDPNIIITEKKAGRKGRGPRKA